MLRLLVSAHLIKWKAIVGILWLLFLRNGDCSEGPEAFFEHRLPANAGPALCLQQLKPFGLPALVENRLALDLGRGKTRLALLLSQQKLDIYERIRAGLVLGRDTNQGTLHGGLIAESERFENADGQIYPAGLVALSRGTGGLKLNALVELSPGQKRVRASLALIARIGSSLDLRYDIFRDTSLLRAEEELAIAWRRRPLTLGLGWRVGRGWRVRGGFMIATFQVKLDLLLHPVLPASEIWSLGWQSSGGVSQ